jgi:hypothetical protein
VFDHTKWIFYAATCYTWLGDDEPAEEHAREIIAYHTNPDGSSNAPMRTANAHIDLGIVLARHGELDEAVDHGLQAFQFERKTEASLLSRAADLDHDLTQRYPANASSSPSTSGTPTHGAPYGTRQQETTSCRHWHRARHHGLVIRQLMCDRSRSLLST